MSHRTEQLRRQQRRVLGVSMIFAVAVHALVFVGMPEFTTTSFEGNVVEVDTSADLLVTWDFVDARFGPPEVISPDGTIVRMPPERVLEVPHVDVGLLQLPSECQQRTRASMLPSSGHVRVRLDSAGRVIIAAIRETTGDLCRDELLTSVASSVWYHWIPNDRFPAPVDLIQPLTLLDTSL